MKNLKLKVNWDANLTHPQNILHYLYNLRTEYSQLHLTARWNSAGPIFLVKNH